MRKLLECPWRLNLVKLNLSQSRRSILIPCPLRIQQLSSCDSKSWTAKTKLLIWCSRFWQPELLADFQFSRYVVKRKRSWADSAFTTIIGLRSKMTVSNICSGTMSMLVLLATTFGKVVVLMVKKHLFRATQKKSSLTVQAASSRLLHLLILKRKSRRFNSN